MNRSLVKLMSLSRRLDSMQNRVEEDAGQSTEEQGGIEGEGRHWWKEGGGSTGAVWGQQEGGERGMQEQQGAVHQDWWMQRSGPTRVAATFILL